MHMVRHDDIAPERPTVAIMRIAPFVGQHGCNFICSEDASSSERAGGDEIDGLARSRDVQGDANAYALGLSVGGIGNASELEFIVPTGLPAAITDPGYNRPDPLPASGARRTLLLTLNIEQRALSVRYASARQAFHSRAG